MFRTSTLDGVKLSTLHFCSFILDEELFLTSYIGGWVGARIGLVVEEKKIIVLSCQAMNLGASAILFPS
jgi:hypothetical protein